MTNQRIGRRTPAVTPRAIGRGASLSISARSISARRIGREFLHAVAGLPLGVAAFSWEVSELSVAAGLLITLVGFPLLVAGGLCTRWLGSRLRDFSNAMTGDDVPAPPPFRPRPGVLGWIGSGVADGAAWRARLYLLLKLPLGVASSVTAVVLYASGLTALTYWIWRPFTGCDAGTTSTCHRGGSYVAQHHLDSAVNLSILAVAGLAVLIVTPRVVRGVLALDRMLVRTLLGPRAEPIDAVATPGVGADRKPGR